jgi:probable rRNA maturation factor
VGNIPELRVEVVKAVPAPFRPGDLRGALGAALGVPEIAARLAGAGTLVIRVTGDRELRRLNRSFLGDDHPTDVLAFPSGDAQGHLGDLAISWPAVRRQAAEHGHPDFAELALLAVHGFLHVLGWDHARERERIEMTRLTLAALARAGVEPAPGRI